jgi:DNA-binding NarL/FixJ family response regulator
MERGSGRAACPVRTLLVDDDVSVRQLFRMLLESEPDFVVVGESGTADAAVPMAAREQPDLIVSDVEMPGSSGVEALPHLRAAAPGAAVVLMSSLHPSDIGPVALKAGADAYIDKATGVETLISMLREVIGREVSDDRAAEARLSGSRSVAHLRWPPRCRLATDHRDRGARFSPRCARAGRARSSPERCRCWSPWSAAVVRRAVPWPG